MNRYGSKPKPRQPASAASAEERFLAGEPIDPGSSYAQEFRYERGGKTLVIRYYDGQVWWYLITDKMARDFFRADSKGTWVWSHLRVRGTQHEHRVPAGQR